MNQGSGTKCTDSHCTFHHQAPTVKGGAGGLFHLRLSLMHEKSLILLNLSPEVFTSSS